MAQYEDNKLAGGEDISFDDLYLLLSIQGEDLSNELYSAPTFSYACISCGNARTVLQVV